MRLSDTAIRKAKPKEKPFKLADGGGLFLLVQPSGSKWWRYKYRFGGKEKLLALGAYPETSLLNARKGHLQAREAWRRAMTPERPKEPPSVMLQLRLKTTLNPSPASGLRKIATNGRLITPMTLKSGLKITFFANWGIDRWPTLPRLIYWTCCVSLKHRGRCIWLDA